MKNRIIGKRTFQNFSISLIFIGYYTISTTLLIGRFFDRPVLPFTLLFCSLYFVLIIFKLLRRDFTPYYSPTIVALVFISFMIFANNPYTDASIEKALYFVAVTLVPCLYLYLCRIEPEDYRQIFNFSLMFIVILMVSVAYSYLRVGSFDVRVTTQRESGLYEISVARHLTIAFFIIYYFLKDRYSSLLKKIGGYVLLIVCVSIIIFTGKRQALLSIMLALVIVNLLDVRRPLRTIISIFAVIGFSVFFYSVLLPAVLNSGTLNNTKMADYLERQYYDQDNITSMAGRVDAYKTTFVVIANNPLVGVGFDNFGKYVQEKYNLRNDRGNPHNLWLSILVELGVVTAILVLILLVSFFKNIVMAKHDPASSHYMNEINVLTRMSMTVLLFSMVGFSLGRGVLIFFAVAMLMEKYHQRLLRRAAIVSPRTRRHAMR